MKILFLHTLNCTWCVKTRNLLKESLKELKIKEDFEEIVVDSEEKARKYGFVGSPTIRINGKDIQDKVSKYACAPCEVLCESGKGTSYIKRECESGCRTFLYKSKQYPYPPKGLIKESILMLR